MLNPTYFRTEEERNNSWAKEERKIPAAPPSKQLSWFTPAEDYTALTESL